MKAAIFFDRDGVLNKPLVDGPPPQFPRRFEDFHLYEGLAADLQRLKNAGYLLIVITNQPELARGLLNPTELQKMHDYLLTELPLDDLCMCPHDDHHLCSCRKPKPGMLLEAAKKWNLDLKKSVMIGDTWKDMEAGKGAGCTTCLLERIYNQRVEADIKAATMSAAIDKILRLAKSY